MIVKINGQEHFQVLATNFTIGASATGYELMFSADGVDFSPLFTVSAGQERMVTEVANGAFYYLRGNDGEVSINWQRECHSGGGGGGGYVLPTASADTLGGVKVGENLSIDENGVLSATGGGGSSLPYVYYFDLNQNDKADDAMVAQINTMVDRVLAGDRAFLVNLLFEWEYYGGLTPVNAVEESNGERSVYFNFILYSLYFEQINVGKVGDEYYIRIGVRDNGEGQRVAFREWRPLRLPIYKGGDTSAISAALDEIIG